MTFEQITEIMRKRKVGIAGCGGLGSNCAVALARVGTGTLVLADFDRVSIGNLNRQYYFTDQVGMIKTKALTDTLIRVNPEVHVITHETTLTKDNIPVIFAGCDVIVEAFDMADQKEMIIETIQTMMPSVPLVVGLGMAGWGMSNAVHCRKADNIYICGDEVSGISPELPPIAPRVGMVANMQANVVMEILLNSGIAE